MVEIWKCSTRRGNCTNVLAPKSSARTVPPSPSGAINHPAEEIRCHDDSSDFHGIAGLALDANDGEDREHEEKQGHKKARRGSRAQGEARTDSAGFRREQGNGKQRQISDAVKSK